MVIILYKGMLEKGKYQLIVEATVPENSASGLRSGLFQRSRYLRTFDKPLY
jgi:hypothetical protein